MCKNRLVLFDNKTKDESKRVEQVQQLLFLVNMVIAQNGGQPYTDELFTELKVNFIFFFIIPVNLSVFVQKYLDNNLIYLTGGGDQTPPSTRTG